MTYLIFRTVVVLCAEHFHVIKYGAISGAKRRNTRVLNRLLTNIKSQKMQKKKKRKRISRYEEIELHDITTDASNSCTTDGRSLEIP